MTKFVVCGDPQFYPWVVDFDSYDEAKKYFDENDPGKDETFYLTEVKEMKSRKLQSM